MKEAGSYNPSVSLTAATFPFRDGKKKCHKNIYSAGRELFLYQVFPAIALECSVGATAISAPLKGELSSERITEGFRAFNNCPEGRFQEGQPFSCPVS